MGTIKKIIIISFFVLPACAPPSVITTALIPAKSTEAAKLKQVAVLPFEGQDGKRFASEIEGVLASINIADSQYFSLIDRASWEKILDEEVRLSQTGIVDPRTATKIGKAVGAKGVYTGVVTVTNTVDESYKEQRERCAEYTIKRDKEGKEEKECVRWEKYTVPCISRTATFSFTPKLIEVESGRVVYANNISGTANARGCQDQSPLPSSVDLLENAKRTAKATFRTDVAPSYVTFNVKLMDLTDGITSKDIEKKLKTGLDFAKKERFDRACEIWGEARIGAPNSPSIIYNLGVCAEAVGDVEQALDLYKKADRLLNKPDDRITSALKRAAKALEDKKKLKEQK